MIAAAKHHDRFVMDALWSRFLPSWQRVRALVDNGAIGEVRSASAELGFVTTDAPDGRLLDRAKGGGSAHRCRGLPPRVRVVVPRRTQNDPGAGHDRAHRRRRANQRHIGLRIRRACAGSQFVSRPPRVGRVRRRNRRIHRGRPAHAPREPHRVASPGRRRCRRRSALRVARFAIPAHPRGPVHRRRKETKPRDAARRDAGHPAHDGHHPHADRYAPTTTSLRRSRSRRASPRATSGA